MAGLRGPDFISLQARDLAASRSFYTEVLGLSVDERFTSSDFVLFRSSTILFALTQATDNLDAAPQPGWGITLWLDCDDVDGLHARLQEVNATIIAPPNDGPFGRTFSFVDPDGYRLTANENDWERFPIGG